MIKHAGLGRTKLYLEANQKAVQKYAEIASGISCDFEEKTAYVYSMDDRKKLEEEAEAYRLLGLDDEIVEPTELPFSMAGAVQMRNQAQFHPLKFISAAARGLEIYENTPVKKIRKNCHRIAMN